MGTPSGVARSPSTYLPSPTAEPTNNDAQAARDRNRTQYQTHAEPASSRAVSVPNGGHNGPKRLEAEKRGGVHNMGTFLELNEVDVGEGGLNRV